MPTSSAMPTNERVSWAGTCPMQQRALSTVPSVAPAVLIPLSARVSDVPVLHRFF
ncbi:hypothetical protein DOTSEDRAFT_74724 [Dothistroma septosporum NZE10]|uniref:Uncharacterized protein n=1 Tax=Dothistroma septosporum (strain NZE10 / CBS 128990) TaxID=675120 RepID=N1PC23_DOTSN|nr:hypothetical protein DOTSEDRAFT_74724 [Dothistroma septosporum NZE10]